AVDEGVQARRGGIVARCGVADPAQRGVGLVEQRAQRGVDERLHREGQPHLHLGPPLVVERQHVLEQLGGGKQQHALLLIVICEIAFWILLAGGLAARYLLRRRRLSTALLLAVPLADV